MYDKKNFFTAPEEMVGKIWADNYQDHSHAIYYFFEAQNPKLNESKLKITVLQVKGADTYEWLAFNGVRHKDGAGFKTKEKAYKAAYNFLDKYF